MIKNQLIGLMGTAAMLCMVNTTTGTPLVSIIAQDSPIIEIFNNCPRSIDYVVTNNAPETHTFIWNPNSISPGGVSIPISGICQQALTLGLNTIPGCNVGLNINKKTDLSCAVNRINNYSIPACVYGPQLSASNSMIPAYAAPFILGPSESCLLSLVIEPNYLSPVGLLNAPVICRTEEQNCVVPVLTAGIDIPEGCFIPSSDLSMCALPADDNKLNITIFNV